MTSSGPSLPILNSQDERLQADSFTRVRQPANRWAVLVHAARMVLLMLAILGANRLHQARSVKTRKPVENEVLKTFAQSVWANASRCVGSSDDAWLVEVLDSSDQLVGKLATTSPLADSIVGYAGPSNVMIAISIDGIIQRLELAHSSDTADHVLMVQNDEPFWKQFEGTAWIAEPHGTAAPDATDRRLRPDGVSGATLTSLAIAEAILLRIDASGDVQQASKSISSGPNSLKFAEPLTQDEAMQVAIEASKQFPEQWDTQQITLTSVSSWEVSVMDPSGKTIGRVLRSGPLADQILGYQGPSEVLFCLDSNQTLLVAAFRGTYDNQPYSRYVQEESSYWSKFKGRKITDLASIDLGADGIEGVSGATMTSLAIAETIQESCRRLVELESIRIAQDLEFAGAGSSRPTARERRWNFSLNELFTIGVALIALPWSRSRFRGRPTIRLTWQATCFLGIGWVGGNMLSLALFSGWTQGGIPWQLAPGLAVLLVVAFGSNLLFKRNVYCDHLCPHGIAQQWLQKIPNAWRNRKASTTIKWVERILRISGLVAIGLAISHILIGIHIPVAWLEPFDAYAWRVGLTGSVVVWLTSLAYSFYRPMTYCRSGCPTGMLLNYTRFNAFRSKITLADLALIALLLCIGLRQRW